MPKMPNSLQLRGEFWGLLERKQTRQLSDRETKRRIKQLLQKANPTQGMAKDAG